MEVFNVIFYSHDNGGGNDFEEYDVKHIYVIQTHREGRLRVNVTCAIKQE